MAAAPLGNVDPALGTGNRGAAWPPFTGAGEAVLERGSLPVGCGMPATWRTQAVICQLKLSCRTSLNETVDLRRH